MRSDKCADAVGESGRRFQRPAFKLRDDQSRRERVSGSDGVCQFDFDSWQVDRFVFACDEASPLGSGDANQLDFKPLTNLEANSRSTEPDAASMPRCSSELSNATSSRLSLRMFAAWRDR